MAISAGDVKDLREKTGAGMMDCKKALEECGGDEAAAIKMLKEKGLAAMEKRADRATEEGSFFIETDGKSVAVVELTCETDFVAKNADFIECGGKIAALAVKTGGKSAEMDEMVKAVSVKTRENMALKRIDVVEIPEDCVASTYLHSNKKVASVVVLKVEPASAKTNAAVAEFAHDCCLHLAAFTPLYVKKDDVPKSYIDEQKEIFTTQTAEGFSTQIAELKSQVESEKADGNSTEKLEKKIAEFEKKSANREMCANIAMGKLNKHLAEICFMSQMFVKDDKKTVEQKMQEVGKSCGASISICRAVCDVLGK